MLRSLTIPTRPVSQLFLGNLTIVREISIAGTVDANFRSLLDGRSNSRPGVRKLAAKPGPINEGENPSNKGETDA